MFSVSYTLTPTLKNSLQKIEALRQQILLQPIPPKTELQLRWTAMLNRVFWSASLSGSTITKKEIVSLLTSSSKRDLSKEYQEIVNYKNVLDYISQEWLVSQKQVTPQTAVTVYQLLTGTKNFRLASSKEAELRELFDYVQTGSEHPILIAGIVQLMLMSINAFPNVNNRISRLFCILFLYKYGFDVRQLWTLSELWKRDKGEFEFVTQTAIKQGNLTGWLEYFTRSAVIHLSKIADSINLPHKQFELPASFWEVNDRQKKILSILEEPGATITNKKVQKMFKISQITASRDLAKLATLGLIVAHGKGRSIAYAKI